MNEHRNVALALVCLGLAGCGGGGSASVGGGAVTPPTPPPPAPQSASVAVEPLDHPATQQFAAVGSPLQIRYDRSADRYEVNAGGGWSVLADDPQASPAVGDPNTSFAFDSGRGYFLIRVSYQNTHSQYQYRYSNLAAWGTPVAPAASGHIAFGVPTPANAVPRTGTGAYTGIIEGKSSLLIAYESDMVNAGVVGTVNLQFNFATGALNGDIRPVHYDYVQIPLPTLTFSNTVYATGSTTFSGQFATGLAGQNSFSGQFTGPTAEELIGAFTFPYVVPGTIPGNGTVQQATGAFVAKR